MSFQTHRATRFLMYKFTPWFPRSAGSLWGIFSSRLWQQRHPKKTKLETPSGRAPKVVEPKKVAQKVQTHGVFEGSLNGFWRFWVTKPSYLQHGKIWWRKTSVVGRIMELRVDERGCRRHRCQRAMWEIDFALLRKRGITDNPHKALRKAQNDHLSNGEKSEGHHTWGEHIWVSPHSEHSRGSPKANVYPS